MHPRNQARLDRHAEWFVGHERELQENVMKRATYLFSVQHPKGKLFNLTPDEVPAMLADGWYESPADVPIDGKAPAPRVCPACGQLMGGPKGGPTQGSTEDTPKPPQKSKLLADFEAGKKQTKQQLAALGAELGVELVADDMTAKQMAEEIQAFLDTPALG